MTLKEQCHISRCVNHAYASAHNNLESVGPTFSSLEFKMAPSNEGEPVNSINTGTITSGKSPMFGRSQDGGNNYKCRNSFSTIFPCYLTLFQKGCIEN